MMISPHNPKGSPVTEARDRGAEFLREEKAEEQAKAEA